MIIKFTLIPFAVGVLAYWDGHHDFFSTIGFGLVAAVIGLCIYCWRRESTDDPLLIDNPLPRCYSIAVSDAVHEVKATLVGWTVADSAWRLLRIDPQHGLILACIDLAEVSDEPVAFRTSQVFLLAKFDAEGSSTRLTLRWTVRPKRNPTLHNRIIRQVSQAIASRLIMCCKNRPMSSAAANPPA